MTETKWPTELQIMSFLASGLGSSSVTKKPPGASCHIHCLDVAENGGICDMNMVS